MKSILFILVFFSITSLFGQISLTPPSGNNHAEEHNEIKAESPPHGGVVTEAGKYNIEVLLDPFALDKKITVWLLSQRNKQKELKNMTATLILNYKNGKIIEKEMLVDNGTACSDIDDITNPFNAVIILKRKNNSYSATYFYKGLNK